jgi:hypothetical protein
MARNETVQYAVTIKGTRLMMHNEQLANPFNEYTQELAKLTHKRGKTIEDYRAIAEIEFQGGLYFDAKAGPYIPARCLNKCLVMGARRRKLGKMFEQMVLVDREVNPVIYKGPRSRKELWSALSPTGEHAFADQRLIGVNAARTLRTRPLFTDWRCDFIVKVIDGAVDAADVETAIEAAQSIGILDGRPVYAGQFVMDSFSKMKEAA